MARKDAMPKDRTARHFAQFMTLLHKHHCQQHYVSFYANEMNMTLNTFHPSLKHSDKSVAQWIDEYLILEAKSFLKYSDKSMKEIVNDLNFSDSSFLVSILRNIRNDSYRIQKTVITGEIILIQHPVFNSQRLFIA